MSKGTKQRRKWLAMMMALVMVANPALAYYAQSVDNEPVDTDYSYEQNDDNETSDNGGEYEYTEDSDDGYDENANDTYVSEDEYEYTENDGDEYTDVEEDEYEDVYEEEDEESAEYLEDSDDAYGEEDEYETDADDCQCAYGDYCEELPYLEVVAFVGTGAYYDPIQIATDADFSMLNTISTAGQYFVLTNDFTVVGIPILTVVIHQTFEGTLDGNGHTINLDGVGALFSTIGQNGIVTNLNLTGEVNGSSLATTGALTATNHGTIDQVTSAANVTNGDTTFDVGGLVGVNQVTGLITNSMSTGDVEGDTAGGLVATNWGEISYSYASGTVSFGVNVGGLVGQGIYAGSVIRNSSASGVVTGATNAGGLIGSNAGEITNSHASGRVYFGGTGGGLAGTSTGTIAHSSARGHVTGGQQAGGLVGSTASNASATIIYSFATGDVAGNIAGGLVAVGGGLHPLYISRSFATGNVGTSISSGTTAGLIATLGALGTVSDSFATGVVTSHNSGTGGIATHLQGVATNVFTTSTIITSEAHTGGVIREGTGSLINAVAFNESVIGWWTSARVSPDTNLNIINTHAFHAIPLNGERIISSDPTSSHGASVSRDTLLNDYNYFWTQTMGWDSTVWDFAPGLLPILHGIDASVQGDRVIPNWDVPDLIPPAEALEGDGTPSDPFQISSAEDWDIFNIVGDGAGLYFILTDNISISAMRTTPFAGTFDGGGYTISANIIGAGGFSSAELERAKAEHRDHGHGHAPDIRPTAIGAVGLFHTITETGIVYNLTLTGQMEGTHPVGGVTAWHRGLIENVTSHVAVSGSLDTAAVVGWGHGGILRNVHATGVVNGQTDTGGLVGHMTGGEIIDSSSTGTITGTWSVGGLVGVVDGATRIVNSFASGNVSAQQSVGGLVGTNTWSAMEIVDSFATGNVTASFDSVGGLVGSGGSGTAILNSFASGAVTLNNTSLFNFSVGGLVGQANGSTINSAIAFNSNIATGNGATPQRIAQTNAGTTLINNHAFAGVRINGGLFVPPNSLTSPSGQTVTIETLTEGYQYFWGTVMGWDASVWNFGAGSLPQLANISVAQPSTTIPNADGPFPPAAPLPPEGGTGGGSDEGTNNETITPEAIALDDQEVETGVELSENASGVDPVSQEALAGVYDQQTAVSAVEEALRAYTADEIDITRQELERFIEAAIANAATLVVPGSGIIINQENVEDLQQIAVETRSYIYELLYQYLGEGLGRDIRANVAFITTQSLVVEVLLEPSATRTAIDNVWVRTPSYDVAFSMEFMEANLNTELEVRVTATLNRSYTVSFSRPVDTPITLSVAPNEGDVNYQVLRSRDTGEILGGRHNPMTGLIDTRVNRNDTLVVVEHRLNFGDIEGRSQEMQRAISRLSTAGIMMGTSSHAFSPDMPVDRAQVSAIIMRMTGRLNPNADGGFVDVHPSDWFFGAVGSAQRAGIMNGTSSTRFSPHLDIPKDQFTAILARVLRLEMGFTNPQNPAALLQVFGDADSLLSWSVEDIALATREDLIIRRADGNFLPTAQITRGEAAIMLYRLYQRIW